jgi:hypothetical protein
LATTGKAFERVIPEIVQRQTEEIGLLNTSQFGFRARRSKTLQYIRLMEHVTLNFNNISMCTCAVFLDIEKAFDTTWHHGSLYQLCTLEFSSSLMKLIGSLLSL